MSGSANLGAALRETLDAVVTPVVRDALIHDALRRAGLEGLPRDWAGAAAFITGALRDVTRAALGPELADSVVEELERLILQTGPAPPSVRGHDGSPTQRPLGSQTPPPTRRDFAPTSGTPRSLTPTSVQHRDMTPRPLDGHSYIRGGENRHAGSAVSPSDYFRQVLADGRSVRRSSEPEDAPVPVFVSSGDVGFLRELSLLVAPKAQVTSIRNIVGLIRELDRRSPRRCFIVLDGQSPVLRTEALAAVIDDLGPTTVLVCRDAPERSLLDGLNPNATRSWVRLSRPADVEDVAARCLEEVG